MLPILLEKTLSRKKIRFYSVKRAIFRFDFEPKIFHTRLLTCRYLFYLSCFNCLSCGGEGEASCWKAGFTSTNYWGFFEKFLESYGKLLNAFSRFQRLYDNWMKIGKLLSGRMLWKTFKLFFPLPEAIWKPNENGKVPELEIFLSFLDFSRLAPLPIWSSFISKMDLRGLFRVCDH